jgi:type VI secretion system protein ImpM
MTAPIPPAPGPSSPDPQGSAAQGFGWFGKLPGAGDFVSRRMPYAVQRFWDEWCAQGVDALKAGSSASGTQVWGRTPTWGFVIPAQPGVETAQLGIFVPSCDRVGRVFPFVVAAPLRPEVQAPVLDLAAQLGLAWCEVVAMAQEARLGIEPVDGGLQAALSETLAMNPAPEDDGMSTLPLGLGMPSLPWPHLGRTFDPLGSQSYWWSVPPASTGFQSRTHVGPLRTGHFLDLCRDGNG